VTRGEALVHQALLYGGEDEFLKATVPFLRDGLEDDGAVLAVVAEPNILALKGTMGPDCTPVTFVPAHSFYQHPVRTIAAYSEIVHQSHPKRVWALTEPVLPGLTQPQANEWKRYEAIVNAAFGTTGAQVICAYDMRSTADDVLESASHTHPIVMEGQGPHQSRDYQQPQDFSINGDHRPLPPPATRPDVLPLTENLGCLRTLRTFLTERALHHGLPQQATSPFLMAVGEVATNAILHGAPPMEVRIWAEQRSLRCEVADFGHWRPDALIGHLPRETGLGNFGLWGVRLLADVVEVRTGWAGTVVRLTFGLPELSWTQLSSAESSGARG
jgi:anti-sigma regulatory factor (Ser/Thr protein kinase)